MEPKKPKSSYLTTVSPNPSYWTSSSDNTVNTITDTTPSPVRSINNIRNYSLSPNPRSLSPTSITRKHKSTAPITRKSKPIIPSLQTSSQPPKAKERSRHHKSNSYHLNGITIIRKNSTVNSIQRKYSLSNLYHTSNDISKYPSILINLLSKTKNNLLSKTSNNSPKYHNNIRHNNEYMHQIPYIDQTSYPSYDTKECVQSLQQTGNSECQLSTPGNSAVSLSSSRNNSDTSIPHISLYKTDSNMSHSLTHSITDEKEEKIDTIDTIDTVTNPFSPHNTHNTHNTYNENEYDMNEKNDIIHRQKRKINNLKTELQKANNKIMSLNKKIENYENEIYELKNNVIPYKQEIKKQLVELQQRKHYNQFQPLPISAKSRNNSKKRRRSRTWISNNELNVNEVNNMKNGYQLNNSIDLSETDDNGYHNGYDDDDATVDWSHALSLLNNDTGKQYAYTQNELFYE